jgi:voltage-gated potassium channel
VVSQTKAGPYQLFMLLLCAYVLIAMALEAFAPLPPDAIVILRLVDTGICFIFLADFIYCLVRSRNRLRYFVTWGWIDLASSIPAAGFLRIGRLARLLRILRLLRGVRSTRVLTQFFLNRKAESTFLATATISILLLVFASIAVLEFEKGSDSSITNGEDAIWWAFVTMTTVGYGDEVPVTTGGRIVAVVLMAAGVGLFGTFTALVASWFLEDEGARISARLDKIEEDLTEIRRLLESSPRGGSPSQDG